MPGTRRDEDYEDLDLDDGESAEELDAQVQRAQAELSDLKRRAEQIEKDKARLEELSRRQDEFEAGRAEMVDKLTRSMVVLQRETEGTQKRLEQLHLIHNSFLTHLRTLEGINPRMWVGQDMSKELSKALSCVDDARAEYVKSNAKIMPEVGDEPHHPAVAGDFDEYYAPAEKGFTYWLTAGLAFTLPAIIVAIVLVTLFWYLNGGGVQ